MQGDTCTDEPVIRNAKKKKQLLVSSNQEVRNLQLFTEYKLFQQTTVPIHKSKKRETNLVQYVLKYNPAGTTKFFKSFNSWN